MLMCNTIIVRDVADSLAKEAQRMNANGTAVDMEKAKRQHQKYVEIFRDQLGLRVIEIPADHNLPDCVFVEDVVVVIGTTALITTPGHPSRRLETKEMKNTLEKLANLEIFVMKDLDPNATLDGGDVLFTGQEIFVGQSKRTNSAGIAILSQVFAQYKVISISVSEGLHLKSVCSLASPGKIVIGGSGEEYKQIKSLASNKYEYIEVKGSSAAANCVYLNTKEGSVLLYQSPDVFPETKQIYGTLDVNKKISVDLSEFAKVDGCITCCSILLNL